MSNYVKHFLYGYLPLLLLLQFLGLQNKHWDDNIHSNANWHKQKHAYL